MLKKAKKGQSLVEYGLVLALVSVIAIAALQVIGGSINTASQTAGTQVEDAATNSGSAWCTSIGGAWANGVCTPPA